MTNEATINVAILNWTKKNRPDLIPYITPMGDPGLDGLFASLLAIGFEAGRQFESENPKIPLDQCQLHAE